jgi:hypothetical protein
MTNRRNSDDLLQQRRLQGRDSFESRIHGDIRAGVIRIRWPTYTTVATSITKSFFREVVLGADYR